MSSLRPSFAITAEQEELRDAARAFATSELAELAEELERDNKPVPDEWRKRYDGFHQRTVAVVLLPSGQQHVRVRGLSAQIRRDGLSWHQHTGGVWRSGARTSCKIATLSQTISCRVAASSTAD